MSEGDFGEPSTDGRTGKESAKKFLADNLEEPMHGYSGSKATNQSLINKPKIECLDEKQIEEQETKVVEQFPFIKEGDQEREFPSTKGDSNG